MTKRIIYLSLFIYTLTLYLSPKAYSQGEQRLVLLSGVIVDGANADPVPGVHVYIPMAGRGTTTTAEGFFALPALAGDSIIISAIGYKKQYYIMPYKNTTSFSVVIEIKEDTTLLPIVEIFPYPTEELFKEAVLALQLPDEEKVQRLRENLERQFMFRAAVNVGMDGAMNYRTYMNQQYARMGNQNMYPTLSLLNPFAWAEFFRSVKRGDLKKDKWKK
ncbi:MAG: carboxypeptidase-like regulatory domain-containing protein [Cytophagales bacterium]|nr:MAG: carboxypeptidase-like regulatory domain-containing protein [Cytophagales bacterium]